MINTTAGDFNLGENAGHFWYNIQCSPFIFFAPDNLDRALGVSTRWNGLGGGGEGWNKKMAPKKCFARLKTFFL
jgi:hypothetical protein